MYTTPMPPKQIEKDRYRIMYKLSGTLGIQYFTCFADDSDDAKSQLKNMVNNKPIQILKCGKTMLPYEVHQQ